MINRKRMKQLEEAKELISSASNEEKEELFKNLIVPLKKEKERLDGEDNRFNSHEEAAHTSMNYLRIFLRNMVGYNVGWVPERYLEHCCDNAGRNAKYSSDIRLRNCIFITLLVQRGSSETQAMKLLMRLTGDNAMSGGYLRELRDSFKDYKAFIEDDEGMTLEESWAIADFLSFSIDNLEGDEKASKKAVMAFRSLWQEVIDLMKKYHPIIADRDPSYPDTYGSAIGWIKAEYNDPLDYFYSHEKLSLQELHQKKGYLREYLNTISYFKSH